MVDSATDLIYATDADGRFALYNPTAEQKLGYRPEELIGRHYLDLVRAGYRESVRRYYGRQYASRIPSTYREVPVVAKDGTVYWLGQSTQLVVEGGRVSGFHVVARDVSRRRRRERLARGQRAVLELVARGSPLSASLDRLCHLVEELSEGWCSILIRRGNRLYSASAPSLPAIYVEAVDGTEIGPDGSPCGSAALLKRRVVVADIRHDPRWARYHDLAEQLGIAATWSTPILSGGEVLGTFAVLYHERRAPRDEDLEVVDMSTGLAQIAIERHLEEERIQSLVQERTVELERTRRQLIRARKLEGVGQLAAGLAHEFNNWLTVINLYCEQLARPDAADTAAAVREIGLAARRASSLTRQLLTFGRTQESRPSVIDLNSLVQGLGPMLRALLGSNVDVRIEPGPTPALAKLDQSQFEQVVVNLAMNARDAMPTGGAFTVRSAAEGGRCVLEASDTGTGMDADTLARIFEPFFTTKDPGHGSGIGLASVYGAVRQSGGEITVWSEPGHGSRFRISLPLFAAEPPGLDDTCTQIPRGSGETVLVVDDDAAVRRLVASLLRRLDYRVLEAADGGEAIRKASNAEPPVQLLLTDVALPGLDGKDLARSICSQHGRGAPKVLFMSGHALPETGELCLSKPFSAKALAEKVRATLAR